jgi:hypothetical protein
MEAPLSREVSDLYTVGPQMWTISLTPDQYLGYPTDSWFRPRLFFQVWVPQFLFWALTLHRFSPSVLRGSERSLYEKMIFNTIFKTPNLFQLGELLLWSVSPIQQNRGTEQRLWRHRQLTIAMFFIYVGKYNSNQYLALQRWSTSMSVLCMSIQATFVSTLALTEGFWPRAKWLCNRDLALILSVWTFYWLFRIWA